MNIIAIDCGASFIKGALFNDSLIVKQLHESAPAIDINSDIMNPSHIEALIAIVRNMIDILSCGLNDITLTFSNEMHGFILAHEDGSPFTDYISWQRALCSSSYIRKNAYGGGGHDFLRDSGMPLRSGLPSCNLSWLSNNVITDKTGQLYFYTLGGYLIRRLTGIQPYMHPTNAAATGLYDLTRQDWNHEYISALGIKAVIFPEIGTKAITHGKFCVLPAIGDQQAALLGSGLQDNAALSFNIGTGAQVSRVIDVPEFGEWQIRPYFGGKYIRTIPHIPSGRALNVYFRFVKGIAERFKANAGDPEIWQAIHEAAQNGGSGAGIECDMSFFENAVTSHTNGSITEIGEYSLTLDNLMAAVIHSMADNFVRCAERVNTGLCSVESIIFSGGIANRWPLLVSLITEGLGLDVPVCVSENDTLHGCCNYALGLQA